jgi:hypothetical protein
MGGHVGIILDGRWSRAPLVRDGNGPLVSAASAEQPNGRLDAVHGRCKMMMMMTPSTTPTATTNPNGIAGGCRGHVGGAVTVRREGDLAGRFTQRGGLVIDRIDGMGDTAAKTVWGKAHTRRSRGRTPRAVRGAVRRSRSMAGLCCGGDR